MLIPALGMFADIETKAKVMIRHSMAFHPTSWTLQVHAAATELIRESEQSPIPGDAGFQGIPQM